MSWGQPPAPQHGHADSRRGHTQVPERVSLGLCCIAITPDSHTPAMSPALTGEQSPLTSHFTPNGGMAELHPGRAVGGTAVGSSPCRGGGVDGHSGTWPGGFTAGLWWHPRGLWWHPRGLCWVSPGMRHRGDTGTHPIWTTSTGRPWRRLCWDDKESPNPGQPLCSSCPVSPSAGAWARGCAGVQGRLAQLGLRWSSRPGCHGLGYRI